MSLTIRLLDVEFLGEMAKVAAGRSQSVSGGAALLLMPHAMWQELGQSSRFNEDLSNRRIRRPWDRCGGMKITLRGIFDDAAFPWHGNLTVAARHPSESFAFEEETAGPAPQPYVWSTVRNAICG